MSKINSANQDQISSETILFLFTLDGSNLFGASEDFCLFHNYLYLVFKYKY